METTTLRPYEAVDQDVVIEWPEGTSAGAAARQMAANAKIHGGPMLAKLFEEMLSDANRASFVRGQYLDRLRGLLFALHAYPKPGGPLLDLEEAIAQAIAVLPEKNDMWRQGRKG